MSGKDITDVSTAAGGLARDGQRAARTVAALTIVSHPMPHRAGERLLLGALSAGQEMALARNEPAFARPGSELGAPLADPFISRKPVRLVAGAEGAIRILAGHGNKVVVAGAEVNGSAEISAAAIAAGVPVELSGRVALLLHRATVGEAPPDPFGMVGESAGLMMVRRAIAQVVDLDVPVLVRGETGTGKELVAGAIHAHSPRRAAKLIAVNLGALPKEIAAAELFGAQRGAFTGATRDREGLFRAADGGTLFLDEVGEAPPDVQVLLLRVLETGKLYPVGGHTPVAVDVRLVAATDADLEERIRQGQFKAPLLHRLAGYEVRLPPLRERREDIGLLFLHFAKAELDAIGEGHRLSPSDPYVEPWLPPALASRLVRAPWPGNIRQLRNVTRQLVIGSRGKPSLDMELPIVRELEAAPAAPAATAAPAPVAPGAASAPLAGSAAPAASGTPAPDRDAPRRRRSTEVTEAELVAALREVGWDVKAAADRLQVPRSSIYDLIDRCPSLRRAGDLEAEEIARAHQEHDGDVDRMVQALQVSKRALLRRIKELGLG